MLLSATAIEIGRRGSCPLGLGATACYNGVVRGSKPKRVLLPFLVSVWLSHAILDSYRSFDRQLLTPNEAARFVFSAGLLPTSASGYAKPQTRSTWEHSSNNGVASNFCAAKCHCAKVNLSTAWIPVSNGSHLATSLFAVALTGRSPPLAVSLRRYQIN